ncbi:glycosyltransferase family 2 protein [Geodermatophilus sp. SYSU D00698]
MLSKVRRLGRRMRRPGSSRLFRCLVVADVDLDAETATPRPVSTPFAEPPEGVHAFVWLHGIPVAEVTLAGDPETLLEELPWLARAAAAEAVEDHLAQHAPGSGRPPDERAPCTAEDDRWRATADGALLTVVVCTRDRPDDLELCLTALDGMTVDVAEVLVVDNASTTDHTREVVASHPRARYVREPRRGLDWARNRGLIETRTPLVAYVDDDVLVHPRYAEALLMAFAAHPDAGAITGLVTPAELSTPAQVQFEAAGGFGRGYRQRRLQAESTDPRDTARVVFHIGAIGTGASMAFRRGRILAVGGFDPALDVGTPTHGGGDLEALCRLLTAGDLLVYEPAAVVRHRHRRTMAELRAQRRSDGTGSASLLVGGGRKLGPAHHRQWKLIAARWFAKNTSWTLAGSLLWPRARPMSLTLATAGGWIAALTRGYYRQAVAQARREAAAHPDEPVLHPL